MSFRVVVLWLHLLAVVVWVGGAFFWALILYLQRGRGQSRELSGWVETIGRRVYTIGWEALGVIVITGIFNLIDRARTGVLFQADYLTPLLVKMGLVVSMVGIQLWQHVGILRRPATTVAGDGTTRRHVLIAMGAFLVLAAGAMWMAVQMRYV